MSEDKPKERVRTIAVDPFPKGHRKAVGGAQHDEWNDWLVTATTGALPVNQKNESIAVKASVAICSGMIDLKPADPIEGIIISQLMAANAASLRMYQLAWVNNAEYFEASTKYLQLADKAARTVAMLTERLDHHRNQGKQQIVVQHITTVNANQAVVTDSVVTGKPTTMLHLPPMISDRAPTNQSRCSKRRPRETYRSGVGVQKRNEHQPHAQGPCRSTVSGQIEADGKALSCACGTGL